QLGIPSRDRYLIQVADSCTPVGGPVPRNSPLRGRQFYVRPAAILPLSLTPILLQSQPRLRGFVRIPILWIGAANMRQQVSQLPYWRIGRLNIAPDNPQ